MGAEENYLTEALNIMLWCLNWLLSVAILLEELTMKVDVRESIFLLILYI